MKKMLRKKMTKYQKARRASARIVTKRSNVKRARQATADPYRYES